MFFKKQKSNEPAPDDSAEPSSGSPPETEADAAVDTLAQVLRTYGEHAFDTAQTDRADAAESFDTWARHLLLGVPPPGDAAVVEGVRDFPGVLRFTTEHRRQESEYVVRSLADLRSALWLFVQGVARAIPNDRAFDDAVDTELDRVRSCLDSSDTEEIRRVVMESTSAIEAAITERQEHSNNQIAALSARIDEFSSELLEAKEQLERDPLTSLFNRRAFDEIVERMLDLARMSGFRSTLFLIDVDDFKWVNDHFGHPAGDEVLKQVALTLGSCFARRGDFVARYGGDEFAAIVRSESDEVDAELGGNAVLRVRDLEIPDGDESIRVTLSIGAAQCLPDDDPAAWLSRADKALYHAKRSGRDQYARVADCADEPEE